MKKIQLVALVLVLLQACAPDTITGTGPVTLTYYQQQAFDKWRKGKTAEDPLYFFLRKGGGVYWVYCPGTVMICREATEFKWHSKCEEKYGTGMCKLYGVWGGVVWKTEQPVDPNWYNEYPSERSRIIETKNKTRLEQKCLYGNKSACKSLNNPTSEPEPTENVGFKGVQAHCPDGSIDNGKGECLVHRKEVNPERSSNTSFGKKFVTGVPSPDAPKTSKPKATENDCPDGSIDNGKGQCVVTLMPISTLCGSALNGHLSYWTDETHRQDYVKEAKRRGISLSDCRKALGITLEKTKVEPSSSKVSPADTSTDTGQRLRELKKLLEEGLITKEEAAVKRKEILKNL